MSSGNNVLQSQMRYHEYIIVQYTIWIISTPSQPQLLSCLAQCLEHLVYNQGVASSSLSSASSQYLLCWYQECLCPEKTMYLSDKKPIIDEKQKMCNDEKFSFELFMENVLGNWKFYISLPTKKCQIMNQMTFLVPLNEILAVPSLYPKTSTILILVL